MERAPDLGEHPAQSSDGPPNQDQTSLGALGHLNLFNHLPVHYKGTNLPPLRAPLGFPPKNEQHSSDSTPPRLAPPTEKKTQTVMSLDCRGILALRGRRSRQYGGPHGATFVTALTPFYPLSMDRKAEFKRWKTQCLGKADLSRKGSLDEDVVELVQLLNEQERFFTTSSCSGRIVLLDGVRTLSRWGRDGTCRGGSAASGAGSPLSLAPSQSLSVFLVV